MSIHQWEANGELARREKAVYGTVVSHELANHNQHGYRFVLNGQTYTGLSHSPHDAPQLGEQVLIYYDPNDPAKNSLIDFAELQSRSLAGVPVLFFGIGTVFVAIFFLRRKHLPPKLPNM